MMKYRELCRNLFVFNVGHSHVELASDVFAGALRVISSSVQNSLPTSSRSACQTHPLTVYSAHVGVGCLVSLKV